MNKLLDKFLADPTLTNAKKLVVYLDRHPMAECVVMVHEAQYIAIARRMVELDKADRATA